MPTRPLPDNPDIDKLKGIAKLVRDLVRAGDADTTALVVASSTINGPGTLTNATGRSLTLFSSTVNAPFVNDGLLVSSGSSTIGSRPPVM